MIDFISLARRPLLLTLGLSVSIPMLCACPESANASVPAKSGAKAQAFDAPKSDDNVETKIDHKVSMDTARAWAQELLIVDTHIDVPYRLWDHRDDKGVPHEDVSKRTDKGNFDAIRAKMGGLNAPFMSIYTPADKEAYDAKKKPVWSGSKKEADGLIDLVEGLAKRNPETFVVAHSTAAVRKAFAAGKIAFPLGMENGSPLEGKLENLKHFYDRGVRYITLAHSKDNHICDSSYDDRHINGGLSPFGKTVVTEMNRLGIMVDVSHLSDDGIKDVLAVTTKPVVATHSSARHYTPGFERNLSDDLIRAIAKNNGVVQINFGSTFIDNGLRTRADARYKEWKAIAATKAFANKAAEHEAKKAFYASRPLGFASVQQVVDHIEHVIALVGVNHVGFGSDYDGVGDSLPYGAKDVASYPNVIRVLIERGHDKADIAKIAGENLMRVWTANEAPANEAPANEAPPPAK